jgi:hypothetical protein
VRIRKFSLGAAVVVALGVGLTGGPDEATNTGINEPCA